MKNQKGITLVALVVTIVVLLILAGTSIAMLQGDNGIITNAQKSAAANTEGAVIENMNNAYNTIKTIILSKSSTDVTYDATATATELELAQKVVDELGLTETIASGTDVTGNGYTVAYSSSAHTITITYTDSKFKSGVTVAGVSLAPITGTYTIESSDVKYTSKPTAKF